MSEEKTEKPTPKKLRDARNKGQVAHSKDIVSTTTLCSMFLLLIATADFYFYHLSNLIELPGRYITLPFEKALPLILHDVLYKLMLLSLLPVLVVIVSAVLSNILQVGAIFSVDPIIPKFEKMNPIKGFKNLFSIKNLIEFFKSIFKVTVLSILVYLLLKHHLNDFAILHYCEIQCLTPFIGILLKKMILVTALIFICMAAADHFIQKSQFIKQQKMSKDEVKREHKQTDGSPEVKSNRKKIHREMMNSSIPSQVKKCSAIITNPTHLAVGIYYEKGIEDVPKVMVKGADNIAETIKKIAADEGIPIMENVPLARGLWQRTGVNEYVPVDLFEPVAAVLQWAESLEEPKK